MVQVVDALVVTLGLDTTQYDAAQKKAAASLDKTKESAASTAKEMQSRGGQAAEFFTKVRNEALSLAAVLVGGRGLEALTRDTVTNLAALGRAANDIGLSVPKLAELRNMVAASGGNAEAATRSFTNLALSIQRAQQGQGISAPLQTFFNRIGASPSDSLDVIYSKFNAWAQGRNAREVLVAGEQGGLDEGTSRAAMVPVAEFQKRLAEAVKRGLPTKEMTDNMRALESAFTKTLQAAQHLTDEGLNKLAPALTRVLDVITDFIIKHPDIASAIGIGVTTAAGGGLLGWLSRLLGGGVAAGGGAVTGGAGGAGGILGRGLLTRLLGGLGISYLFDEIQKYHLAPKRPGESARDRVRRSLGDTTGGGDGGGIVGGSGAGADAAGRDRQAYDFFRGKGYSPVHAAALAGGIQGESGFNPNARGDNGEAWGIGQWHIDRVMAILAGTGIDVRTAPYDQQLEAMHWELNNTEGAAGNKFRATTNIGDASRALVYEYERSKFKIRDTARRTATSNSYLDRFGPGVSGTSSTSNTNSAETHIGQIVVNTQATDAAGIAAGIGQSMREQGLYVAQANTGIW